MSENNNCSGQCFEQFDHLLPFYVKKNLNCDCTLVKCPNYDICKSELPEYLIGCYRGYCLNCDMKRNSNNDVNIFTKKSEIKEECPVCLENNYIYKLMECNHYLCGDCIHNLYYTNYGKLEDYPIRPEFPYNNCKKYDEEEETKCDCGNCDDYNENGVHIYFENEDDPKWLDDEKIQKWKKEDDWFELFCKVHIDEPKLNHCPYCRKEQNYEMI